MPEVTNNPIQVSYVVRDIATAVAAYNRLRWHRSKSGPYGYYEPRTADTPQPAIIDSNLAGPHQLNGKTLKFRVGGTDDVSVTFTSADPVTTAAAAAEINAATPLVVASATPDDFLRLTTVTTGTGASIEILDGDANPFLGWQTQDGATGLDQDSVLVNGTHEYFFTDQNSHRDYWYRVEFLNTSTGATSGLGVPFPANQADSVPRSLTIVGGIRLADQTGYPLPGRKITFYNAGMPNFIPDQNRSTGWGIARQYAQIETDRNGYAEFRFIRGAVVDMNIEGGITRRIKVPDQGDFFDLLDPSLVTEDEFGVREANIPFAIRTT